MGGLIGIVQQLLTQLMEQSQNLFLMCWAAVEGD
jgi:hypothetical protein